MAAPGFKAATVTFRQEPSLTAEKWHCEALWLTLARNALYASLSFSCITSCSDAKKKLGIPIVADVQLERRILGI